MHSSDAVKRHDTFDDRARRFEVGATALLDPAASHHAVIRGVATGAGLTEV